MTRKAYDGRVCGSETDNHSYWLVAAQKAFDNCVPIGSTILCRPLDVPPGYDSLDRGAFEGVNKDDMVIRYVSNPPHDQYRADLESRSAVRTWVSNGLKNVREEANEDDLDAERFDEIDSRGLRAPGVTYIPVCSMDEAFNNYEWLGEQRGLEKPEDIWPEFPCNKA